MLVVLKNVLTVLVLSITPENFFRKSENCLMKTNRNKCFSKVAYIVMFVPEISRPEWMKNCLNHFPLYFYV